MTYQWNKQEYRKLMDDICSESCSPDHYCILKEFLVSSHPSPRLLKQLKCMEIFKWCLSSDVGYDVGWHKAGLKWAEKGYAEIFAKVYKDEESARDIYKKVVEMAKQTKEIEHVEPEISLPSKKSFLKRIVLKILLRISN